MDLVDLVDAKLPQTQCTKCGYDGCRPYARAIVQGEAEINRCPPGGDSGIAQLAALLGRPVLALDETRGRHLPLHVARIDEEHCIGCTLCIQACPVDAIVGANKAMHTVLPGLCTGCELCVAPCPVDCISMAPVAPTRPWTSDDAGAARVRYRRRQARLARESQEDQERLRARSAEHRRTPDSTAAAPAGKPEDEAAARKRAILEAALARARARRGH
ncbi:MAG: electron transport complex subunit RsxB [Pigmentiphaga sp.]|uniref:electron transport complex subunit RsxB n=1 Tax=Pigmentiphaga sp. TaxID=1977564 RepID=UPI0029B5DE2E|nr:electron transport complex subunit RsxB [Pigmentiphaga sp.]MDX3907258.1 electron transport complex subunit RsxB [Pigmentiphaga sp.]